MSGDPVSWVLIERGWKVVDAAGNEIGRVEDVAGEHDIFDGLVVSAGVLSRATYVPAEHVRKIFEGEIHLDIAKDEVEELDDDAPASVARVVRPRTWWARLIGR